MKTLIKILCLSMLWFSCESDVQGCTDSEACNYNSNATIENNTCIYEIDECGECGGDGAIYDCGCYDIPEGECNCDGGIEDCTGECGGNAIVDECGICNGDGIADGACDCDGNVEDCEGVCNGNNTNMDCGGSCDNEHVQLWPNLNVCENNEVENGCNGCFNIEETTWLWIMHDFDTVLTDIPPQIGELINLRDLYITANNITGEIPPEIGNLTNLESLSIGGQLTGEIPSEIGNLTNLTSLNLSYNQLTGEIPPEIGNLSNLDGLRLGFNQLTGEIPPEIGNLSKLLYIYLNNNQLSGQIPESICDNNPYSEHFSSDNHSFSFNQLCPPYPECLDEGIIGQQDTSNCP